MSTALITGASGGIGAVYARHLAARGHDLVLVARSTEKLEALASELRAAHAVAVEIITADLTVSADLSRVEQRLRVGTPVDLLVNNAGAALLGSFSDADPDKMEQVLSLNVTAPTRLASAAVGAMVARGTGAIINIGSVVSLMPAYFPGIYAATKAYILTLSQGLAAEFGPKGVYVQAVLPAATRTDIWAKAGADIDQIPNVMEVDDLVTAALVGFDRREPVTIPPLADAGLWDALENARAIFPSGLGGAPAERYRAPASA
ncbi:SDR family oxidoreductase [Ancylobacter sp. WKF20]|uniref:SDR family NAD(P)-dependent oxidoreductase n=1 Tax=Ancylobacter sp. WKF20 TaxID=3039801 RepID=UPI002434387D|nr:SDR family oxidoreductase [Ancylobacter sp. WKF20]WGD32231.1 SDR family oxidoreductase [Ancylobacter sp. WKF20]